MTKCISLSTMMFLGIQAPFCNQNVPSLSSLVSQFFFTFKNKEEKEAFNQQLIKGTFNIEFLKFDGVTLENMDLSGMYLRGIDFSGCTFINVKLQNADLTNTKLDRVKLDSLTQLKGATLFYASEEDKDQTLRADLMNVGSDWKMRNELIFYHIAYKKSHEAIKVTNTYDLVYHYSQLRKKVRILKFNKLDPQVPILLDKADFLNNIIGSIDIPLINQNLSNFDFTGMNFNCVCLTGTFIKGGWLSENVPVFDHTKEDKNNLFQGWEHGIKEYQVLWNTKCDLIQGVSSYTVRKALEKKVKLGIDLRNGYLANVDLTLADLENAKLQEVSFSHALLNSAVLKNAELQNANFYEARLEQANLENAELQNANFKEAYLGGANLENAKLQNANMRGAHLEEARLENADLSYAILAESNLENAKLQNAKLYKTNFRSANLKGAQLSFNYILDYNTEEDLIGIYEECQDLEARQQLKQILIGKQLIADE